MPDLTCFGEVLLRLSAPGEHRLLHTPHLEWHVGGSELNVAAQAARLGVSSRIVSVLPDNIMADRLLSGIRDVGVATDAVQRRGPRIGSYFHERGSSERPLHVVYDRAGSSFAIATPAEYPWSTLLADTRWFHSSGITAALGEGVVCALAEAARIASSLGIPVSVDLNYRAALWTDRDPQLVLPAIVQHIDLIIGNPSACEATLGVGTSDTSVDGLLDLARRVRDRTRARRVAITHRVVESSVHHRFGAVYLDGETDEAIAEAPWSSPVVDRVGSGDAFAGALVASLLQGESPVQALPLAVAAAIAKLGVDGDMARHGRADLEALVRVQRAAR